MNRPNDKSKTAGTRSIKDVAGSIYRNEQHPNVEIALPDDMRPLTYAEAAKLLGVSQKTVETIARVRGEIPIVRLLKAPRLLYGDVIAYIQKGGSKTADDNQSLL